MSDSIFSRIIRGEIPAYRLYEDDNCVIILDIHPINPGHCLVIPRQQIDQFTDLGSELFVQLCRVAHNYALHLKKTLGCDRVALEIDGRDVPHVHIHLIPLSAGQQTFRDGRFDEDVDHSALRRMMEQLAETHD
jgi:histidine triad (HIT) family protein